jgi:hypothetical protein
MGHALLEAALSARVPRLVHCAVCAGRGWCTLAAMQGVMLPWHKFILHVGCTALSVHAGAFRTQQGTAGLTVSSRCSRSPVSLAAAYLDNSVNFQHRFSSGSDHHALISARLQAGSSNQVCQTASLGEAALGMYYVIKPSQLQLPAQA